MAGYRLSPWAEADLMDIAAYMESGRHVVFYRVDDVGVLVSRILHERMSPESHDELN